MGLFSRIRGRLWHSGTQADKLDARSVPELFNEAKEALWEIEAENRDLDLTQPVLAIDKVLKQQQAKWESAQRLSRTKAKPEVQKNATRKEWQNHGE